MTFPNRKNIQILFSLVFMAVVSVGYSAVDSTASIGTKISATTAISFEFRKC